MWALESLLLQARVEMEIVALLCKKALWVISGLVPAFHRSRLTLHPSPTHGCQRANGLAQGHNSPV